MPSSALEAQVCGACKKVQPLDSKNEQEITDKLHSFFKGKTVLIIAHRLSTVRNADNLLVLDKGKIIEEGNHNYLINNKKSYYYNLVQNQLNM